MALFFPKLDFRGIKVKVFKNMKEEIFSRYESEISQIRERSVKEATPWFPKAEEICTPLLAKTICEAARCQAETVECSIER